MGKKNCNLYRVMKIYSNKFFILFTTVCSIDNFTRRCDGVNIYIVFGGFPYFCIFEFPTLHTWLTCYFFLLSYLTSVLFFFTLVLVSHLYIHIYRASFSSYFVFLACLALVLNFLYPSCLNDVLIFL